MSLSKDFWKRFDTKLGIYNAKEKYIRDYAPWNKGKEVLLLVKTGDRKGAGTDANVYATLYDAEGHSTERLLLDKWFRDDLEQGQTDDFRFPIPENFGEVKKLELWRDDKFLKSEWYCEVLAVYDPGRNLTSYFPVHRWVVAFVHYFLHVNDTWLPQYDPEAEQRLRALEVKKEKYQLEQKSPGAPPQIKTLPEDEEFSKDYAEELKERQKVLRRKGAWARLTVLRLETLDDFDGFYDSGAFKPPKSYERESLFDDLYFGAQRLVGANPTQIKLCTEIPDNFGVTDEMLFPFLDGMSLTEALREKRLFLVDHAILDGIKTAGNTTLCSPLALFYMNVNRQLVPVAIQLFQKKAPDNPVFLPNDPKYTWTMAKMWFNHADAAVHQSLVHLGLTHILMEGFAVCVNRHLAPNHPIFRLLAPHFIHLLAINTRALEALINPGGYLDRAMSVGVSGVVNILKKRMETYNFGVHCSLPEELKSRGVDDHKILPNYPYRDDGLMYHYAIRDYVKEIVNHYYDTDAKMKEDSELQAWIGQVVSPLDKDGLGLQGVPGDGSFTNKDDLIAVLTSIIFTCSVQHGAVNFPQYDEYGYPPNYPGYMHAEPPRDKSELTERSLVDALPDVKECVEMIVIMRILSEMGGNPLGDWDFQFQYDPPALLAEEALRKKLEDIGEILEERERYRSPPYDYDYLYTQNVPNAINI